MTCSLNSRLFNITHMWGIINITLICMCMYTLYVQLYDMYVPSVVFYRFEPHSFYTA